MFQNLPMRPCVRFLIAIALLWLEIIDPVAEELNPVGMVWIAGGVFTMGSDLPGSQRNEQPPHKSQLMASGSTSMRSPMRNFENLLKPPATKRPPNIR